MILRRATPLLLAVASLLVAGSASAGLDKEAKKWLVGVSPLITADEQKMYEGLKDKNDQLEFQKIFWARRDPDLSTPENEYEVQYEKLRAEADQRFKVMGGPGSATDCGRVFILLGEPTEVKANTDVLRDDNVESVRERLGAGGRNPEVWHYRSARFAGGEAVIAFDNGCMGPRTDSFRKQMDRVAQEKVVNPNIDYRLGKDGHLVKLAELLPKPSPATELLKTPRQDFSVSSETDFLKAQGGGTVVLAVLKGDAAGLPVETSGAAKHVRVVVCAQAMAADGKVAATTDQESDADVGADGEFRASFRLVLKPGKYTLRAGALEPKSGKGSVADMPIEIPDFNAGALEATAFFLDGVEEKASANPTDAYAAFMLGQARLVPHVGATYSKSQPLWFFFQYYDAQADEKTGKAAVSVAVTIYRGTAPLAKAPEQTYDTSIGGTAIGPVDLTKYIPGKFKVEIKISDGVAKKEITKELAFELTK